jgi:hypothetical protein
MRLSKISRKFSWLSGFFSDDRPGPGQPSVMPRDDQRQPRKRERLDFEIVIIIAALIASLVIVGWIILFIRVEAARLPRRTLPTDAKGVVIVKYQGNVPARIRWRQA